MKRYKGNYAHMTDIGRVRVSNEDQAAVLTNEHGDVLLIVCDGMGGQNKGDYASRTAIESLAEAFRNKKTPWFLPKVWLMRAIRAANSLIYEQAEKNKNYAGMGTTLVAALLIGDRLYVANVGDSRAYIYSPEIGMLHLTSDQTYVEYLYRTGQIDKEEIYTHPERHALMNALGIFPSAAMDLYSRSYHGESILLCSDGLYNNLSETEIRAVLASDQRADQKVKSLIIDANGNGGSDNIGIAFWEAIL